MADKNHFKGMSIGDHSGANSPDSWQLFYEIYKLLVIWFPSVSHYYFMNSCLKVILSLTKGVHVAIFI